jgi:CTP-dependent riboflavin kinase
MLEIIAPVSIKDTVGIQNGDKIKIKMLIQPSG